MQVIAFMHLLVVRNPLSLLSEVLVERLSARAAVVRRWAVDALAGMDVRAEQAQAVARLLTDSDAAVARHAASALPRLGPFSRAALAQRTCPVRFYIGFAAAKPRPYGNTSVSNFWVVWFV